MGILTDFGKKFGTDSSSVARIVRQLMEGEYRANVEDIIRQADEWRPALDNGYTFRTEMEARCNYLTGSMWGDMQAVISKRFPQTANKIINEQLSLQLYRRLITAKARAFYGQGTRFYLEGDGGEELPPEHPSQVEFQRMIEKGRFMSALKDADKYTQSLTRCCVKLWWDARLRSVNCTVWPQHLVHFLPDPSRYWSMDDCPAVLFEMPGRGGLSSADARYEVWAKALDGASWRAIHFRAGKETVVEVRKSGEVDRKVAWYEEHINESDSFPFRDQETGEPVYPFWWWQGDTLLQLYAVGPEDALTLPRQVNSALTDMNHSMHFNANPIGQWVPTRDDVTSSPPAVIKIGPGEMVQGGDWKIEFAHPQYDATAVQGVWSAMADLAVQMDLGTSSGVTQKETSAESGVSIAIKRQPLYEYRQDMIEIYRPHVNETLRRAIMVHNEYAGTKITGTPCWEPGDMVETQDKEAEGRLWTLKIEKNLATPVDWLMHETGMDREQAEERIRQNAKQNKELRESSMVAMPNMNIRSPAQPFGGKPKDEETEEVGDK